MRFAFDGRPLLLMMKGVEDFNWIMKDETSFLKHGKKSDGAGSTIVTLPPVKEKSAPISLIAIFWLMSRGD